MNRAYKQKRGFTLVEVLVSTFVFAMIAMAIYKSIASIYQVHETTDAKVVATGLATEQMEIIRNLPYSSVGIKSGLPLGVIDRVQSISRSNYAFDVVTTIRSIDDSFDGEFPADTVPADYKLVQIDIDCGNCKNFTPLSFTTTVAPKSLETPTDSGALFIQAIDASGLPVPQADVQIINNSTVPSISLQDTTNNSGLLQVVSAPPGTNTYKVIVTKDGYSTEETFAPGGAGNPNPIKAHPSVVRQQVTQLSFIIDRLSTVNISTVNAQCGVIPSVPITMSGSKIVGLPNVLKYIYSSSTNASGVLTLSNLEWDTYNATHTNPLYDFAGSIPVLPMNVTPGSVQDLKIILVNSTSSKSQLVTVLDEATNLPISGAVVVLTGATTTSLTTGRGVVSQSSWVGGGGQENFSDKTMYFSAQYADTTSNTNGVMLQSVSGTYISSSTLISSTFDTGDISNFYQLSWSPQTQPIQTGEGSVRFQIATNNDNATWNFVGPDGTSNSYYSGSGGTISSVHNATRYIRYKMYLQTSQNTHTPNISNVSIAFTSACTPLGQVLFQELPQGTYSISVSKSGYQMYSGTINVLSPWQHEVVELRI